MEGEKLHKKEKPPIVDNSSMAGPILEAEAEITELNYKIVERQEFIDELLAKIDAGPKRGYSESDVKIFAGMVEEGKQMVAELKDERAQFLEQLMRMRNIDADARKVLEKHNPKRAN